MLPHDPRAARDRDDATPQGGAGRVVGPYRLTRPLGRGSNGVVFLARREGLERQFALKVLDAGLFDEEAVARFQLEAKVASKLDHPGVVGVYDIGTYGGIPYYVMEFCPGPTLAERLHREGRLSPDEAATLVGDLARTLHHAHSQGVLHRDVKPANVILDERSGRPRITDFGLARDPTLARGLTRTGDVLGTPYYMAPEQFRGERDADHRVDVYALGVILYECLTGSRPFAGRSAVELSKRVQRGGARPPRELNAEVPPDLESICVCAMAKHAADRYMSAEALADDLDRYLRGEPPSTARFIAPPRAGARSGALLAAAALGGALAVGVALGAVLLLGGGPPAPTPPEAEAPGAVEPSAPAAHAAAARALEQGRAGIAPERVVADLEQAAELAGADGAERDRITLDLILFLNRRGRFEVAEARASALASATRDDGVAVRAQLARAQALEGLDRRDDAAGAYEAIYGQSPRSAVGLAALAASHRLAKRDARALEAAERALAADELEPAALVELAVQRLRLRDGDGAAEPLERLATLLPDDPRTLFLQGLRLSLRGDIQGGLDRLNTADALLDGAPWVGLLQARAVLSLAVDQPDAAWRDLDAALARRPEDTSLLIQRGRAAWRIGSRDWTELRWKEQAVDDWRHARATDRRAFDEQLGSLPRDAKLMIEALVAEGPERDEGQPGWADGVGPRLAMRLDARAAGAVPAARELLRGALQRAADGAPYADAAAAYAAAERAAPDCRVVALELARFQTGRHAYRPALAAIARARRLGAPDDELTLLEALAHWYGGKRHLAAPLFEALAERDGGANGQSARAWLWVAHDEDASAIAAAEAAVAARPDSWEAHTVLSIALTNGDKTRLEEAQTAAQCALALTGGISVHAMLAELYAVESRALHHRDGSERHSVSPRSMMRLVSVFAGYERLFDVDGGPSSHLAAASSALQFTGATPWIGQVRPWIQEAIRRQADRGDSYVYLGVLELNQERGRDAVLAAWRKAREVEPRVRYPQAYLDGFAEQYGEDDPALVELRGLADDR